jgi:two-component system copper resistance phosphate regulon response regulator CusR
MRILLVEDEDKVSRFVERGLKAELHVVDLAPDGATALHLLQDFAYDLVVLDLNLPDISGNEVLSSMRRAGKSTPVLVLTARDGIAAKVESFDLGADDYLTKPFSFTELLLRVKALLRRGQTPARSNVLTVGDLVLDRDVHQVKRGGKPIELTSREFALLDYLMSNAGRVLSRTMIMENVWDQSFEGLTNIVDVYIRQLRKKIDDGNSVKLLRTIRGVGYSIHEEGA